MRHFIVFLLILPFLGQAQLKDHFQLEPEKLKTTIEKFKKDPRGPYKDLRWFCNDGSINMPKEPCESGGVQHARYKDEVVALGEKSHVYLGQILASTDKEAFWDEDYQNARMKEYQLEKYLKSIDDGWIHRKSQFYRGSIQAEDETAWGKAFFIWLLEKDEPLKRDFYLIRQAIKDIPHTDDSNVAQLMRSQSKAIADDMSSFMNIRIKIHGQPTPADIDLVKKFARDNASKIDASMKKRFEDLTKTMEEFFAPVDIENLKSRLSPVSNASIKNQLVLNLDNLKTQNDPKFLLNEGSQALMFIRQHILDETSGEGRLALMDTSLKLEQLIISTLNRDSVLTLKENLEQICWLAQASAASGYSELWEWNQLTGTLNAAYDEQVSLEKLNEVLIAARNQIEWGVSKNKSTYDDVVSYYSTFEPKSQGFLDDKIRGSVALYLGQSVSRLGDFIIETANLTNNVLDVPSQSQIHGLNPGLAFGKLIVIDEVTPNMEVSSDNIYVFQRPPSDLNPVAGILNISEGNLVSHLQLLARNLGIPNTAINQEHFEALKKYNGKKVFYAVSNKGTVIIKPEDQMLEKERQLFAKVEKSEDMIEVPVERLRLDRTTIMNLTEVDAKSSGIYCGPKAANLGELKQNFPDHVVDGFVIPFGIFKMHLEQQIPGKSETYWEFLKNIYATANAMKERGESASSIETYQLKQLKTLNQLIMDMPLKESFIKDLENSFTSILKKPMGSQPVFLRSDTNMEDLASFTGAGINLTLFNVLEKQKILDGIKQVWASPFFERSFKWRQKYLNNPENVYPSIVVIPGVNNDMSGVMITKGVNTGNLDEITVAMSRGVGGAVEGQIAETWRIKNDGTTFLISPSREVYYNALSTKGGTESIPVTLEQRVLDAEKLNKLNSFSKDLVKKMKSKGINGPYDVELGFKDDKIWLFQVRPFVENKNALNSEYLESITPKMDYAKKIDLTTKL